MAAERVLIRINVSGNTFQPLQLSRKTLPQQFAIQVNFFSIFYIYFQDVKHARTIAFVLHAKVIDI